MKINGKYYPLWSKFVERKEEWIGGVIEDFGDSLDVQLGYKGKRGIITDITLEPNGDSSAFFSVASEGWECGFDVGHGGILGEPNSQEWITFSGYMGHKWRIKQK